MLKLFGAGLTMFSCFAAGCLICAEMKKRIHILEELRRMTVMLSAEIGYANTMLDEVKMQHLKEMCTMEKTVAVGEIGLDYYWDKESHELQKEWFKKQMELAKEVDLPVIVHSREAAQDTFDLIKSEHAGTTGGVIHCFSGSKEMAKEYIKMGYYIGVGGVVTFKNARVLKEVVESIPLERILTETDCPYLAPVPFRGKRNCSAYISYVLDMIAELKGISREEAEQVTYENARNMYRITD